VIRGGYPLKSGSSHRELCENLGQPMSWSIVTRPCGDDLVRLREPVIVDNPDNAKSKTRQTAVGRCIEHSRHRLVVANQYSTPLTSGNKNSIEKIPSTYLVRCSLTSFCGNPGTRGQRSHHPSSKSALSKGSRPAATLPFRKVPLSGPRAEHFIGRDCRVTVRCHRRGLGPLSLSAGLQIFHCFFSTAKKSRRAKKCRAGKPTFPIFQSRQRVCHRRQINAQFCTWFPRRHLLGSWRHLR